jgi:putative ABC transport system substrate-binding protein
MRVVLLFLTLVLAAPLRAEAKPPSIPRVGVLWPWSAHMAAPRAEAFRQGLRGRGYVEGRNTAVESRYAEAPDRLPGLAADLVRLDLDVIVTVGTQATLAVKNATATTPVVFVGAGDPVATEVESLSRPGRNITGLSVMSTALSGKWLELLREAVPRPRSPDSAARDRRPLGGWL